MELFNKLGAEIENLWRDKNYDERFVSRIDGASLERSKTA